MWAEKEMFTACLFCLRNTICSLLGRRGSMSSFERTVIPLINLP